MFVSFQIYFDAHLWLVNLIVCKRNLIDTFKTSYFGFFSLQLLIWNQSTREQKDDITSFYTWCASEVLLSNSKDVKFWQSFENLSKTSWGQSWNCCLYFRSRDTELNWIGRRYKTEFSMSMQRTCATLVKVSVTRILPICICCQIILVFYGYYCLSSI